LEDIAEIGSLTEADLCSKGSQEDPDSSPDKSTEEVKEGIELENLDASLTEAELTAPSSHNPNVQKQVSNRHLKFNFVTEKHRIRQESTTNMFGGFGEMNQAVKLYQKIGANVKDGKYETLDKLYMGSSEVAIMKESRIKFQAREKSIRQTTAFTLFLFPRLRSHLGPCGRHWIPKCPLVLRVLHDQYRFWVGQSPIDIFGLFSLSHMSHVVWGGMCGAGGLHSLPLYLPAKFQTQKEFRQKQSKRSLERRRQRIQIREANSQASKLGQRASVLCQFYRRQCSQE